jgi:hypothetical protein
MARHRRLRRQANQQARAATLPGRQQIHREIQGTRRDQHAELRSARSMGQALQDVISVARREVRGNKLLNPEDKATALAQLSASRISAQAGAAFHTQEVNRDYAGQRTDLRAGLQDLAAQQGATAQSALSELLTAAKEAKATSQENVAQRHFDARQGALDRQADLDVADAKATTDATESHQNAEATLKGVLGKGNYLPQSAADWAAIEGLVNKGAGVTAPSAAKTVHRARTVAALLAISGHKPNEILERLLNQ